MSASLYSPSTAVSPADASGDAVDGYRVCDTVVLVCLACASCVILLTVAACFRRTFADGYVAAAATGGTSAGPAANGGASRRCGVSPSALALLPKLAYRRDAGDGPGWAQCAICLAVVRDGETVRLLPSCGHLFHVNCIDLWLQAHATCPLCRLDVGEAASGAEKV